MSVVQSKSHLGRQLNGLVKVLSQLGRQKKRSGCSLSHFGKRPMSHLTALSQMSSEQSLAKNPEPIGQSVVQRILQLNTFN